MGSPENRYQGLKRVGLWTLLVGYTFILSYANLVYLFIISHFSRITAARIPIALVLLIGIVFITAGFLKRRVLRCVALMAPGALITAAVIFLVPNPNKHIHIPEYVFMAWLVFRALFPDYRGRGILILTFVCASMLGVFDELLQGIHPHRFYGWNDMLVNTGSALIGVLLLAGILEKPSGRWNWVGFLLKLKAYAGAVIFGSVGAAVMCVVLAYIKTSGPLRETYPGWLMATNGLFTVLCVVLFFGLPPVRTLREPEIKGAGDEQKNPHAVTACLWIFPPLVILLAMHILVLLAVWMGWAFI